MEQTQHRQNEEAAKQQPDQINSPEQGRKAGSTQPAANADADISAVDQQEGQMEHGETGGNFNELKEENKRQ